MVLSQKEQTFIGVFVIDNVLHSEKDGDIHYHVYVPPDYDGSRQYPIFFTLPGYEGLYFLGTSENLRAEEFAFEALKYQSEMIIVAPQLNDWGETSANQTVVLVEYFMDYYIIDPERVYANGYSGGGETMSLVLEKRLELFLLISIAVLNGMETMNLLRKIKSRFTLWQAQMMNITVPNQQRGHIKFLVTAIA